MSELIPKVLVVDDDEGILQIISDILESYGFFCILAENFKSAREIFFKEEIDIVITDIQLTDFSGIELVNVFKKAKPELPIIIMSGSGYKKKILPSTIDAFFQKPLDLKQFPLEVRKIFGERKKLLPKKENANWETSSFEEMDHIIETLEKRRSQVGSEKVDSNSYAKIHQSRLIKIANSLNLLMQLCVDQYDKVEHESKSLLLVISRLNFCKLTGN